MNCNVDPEQSVWMLQIFPQQTSNKHSLATDTNQDELAIGSVPIVD